MGDSIHLTTKGTPDCHVFFVTGNPGLISYYTEFFHYLQEEVNNEICPKLTRKTGRKYNGISIYSKSLRGFEIQQNTSRRSTSTNTGAGPPFSLQQQIEFVENELSRYTQTQSVRHDQPSRMKVALVGHSVGAYIILEILRRRNERLKHAWAEQSTQHKLDANADIVASILLFPTIVNIGKSPSGQKASLLLNIPKFPFIAGGFVLALTAILPLSVLIWAVMRVTGMPRNAAEVTSAFLRSRHGVTQALHMARDEMNEIKADRWDEEIWGLDSETQGVRSSATKQPRTKLFFFFGRNDHWVAERTRDDIIATHGRAVAANNDSKDKTLMGRDSRPIMEIDETKLPHGFCLRFSKPVARVVAKYLEQILAEI